LSFPFKRKHQSWNCTDLEPEERRCVALAAAGRAQKRIDLFAKFIKKGIIHAGCRRLHQLVVQGLERRKERGGGGQGARAKNVGMGVGVYSARGKWGFRVKRRQYNKDKELRRKRIAG
jgi:hypothetical protein